MPHGDTSDARYVSCGCSHCIDSRRFAEFCDLANSPERPASIATRHEAAQLLRWYSWQLVSLVEKAKEAN